MLGLHCLTYFATRQNAHARVIIRDGMPKRDYPYGAVGINICATLVDMLGFGKHGRNKLNQPMQPTSGKKQQAKPGDKLKANDSRKGHTEEPLFEFLCRISPHGGRVEDDGWGGFAFEEIFCLAYELLDAMWLQDPPANILFFNQVCLSPLEKFLRGQNICLL